MMWSLRTAVIFPLLLWGFLLIPPFVAAEDNNIINNEIPRFSSGSCLAEGLCCKGRDSSCVVQKAPPNSIIEDLEDIPCYCDAGCVVLNDCCSDYKLSCGVQDCVVGEWEAWGDCDNECGMGAMTRRRPVIQESRNGGKSCPSLLQKRGCRGIRCRHHHQNKISLEDTAVLLPIEFLDKRKYNTSDVVKHLRSRYPKDPEKEESFPYCVEFEVIRSTRACKSLESFMSLREGSLNVCVFCQEEAMKSYADYKCAGTGVLRTTSRFSSLREPACHGKWRQVALGPTCTCSQGPGFIFI